MVCPMGIPTLIVVSGPGGSGKTTLAHRLAATLGCPALCRDEIKEGMVASNPGFVPATSDQLTVRTYELFFEAIALFLRAEVTLVAEAGFQHSNWWNGLEPLTDIAVLKIIRCQAPDEVARRRALTRLAAQLRGLPTPTPSTFRCPGRSTPSTSRPQPSTLILLTAGIQTLRKSPPSAAADERAWEVINRLWRHVGDA